MLKFIRILLISCIVAAGFSGVANAQVSVSVGGGRAGIYVGPDYVAPPYVPAPVVVAPVPVRPMYYNYYHHRLPPPPPPHYHHHHHHHHGHGPGPYYGPNPHHSYYGPNPHGHRR